MKKNYLHNVKKSNRKQLLVYAITKSYMCNEEGRSFTGHEILCAFYSEKIAENKLVELLRESFNENDLTVENLYTFLNELYMEYGNSYNIVKINVDDKNEIY